MGRVGAVILNLYNLTRKLINYLSHVKLQLLKAHVFSWLCQLRSSNELPWCHQGNCTAWQSQCDPGFNYFRAVGHCAVVFCENAGPYASAKTCAVNILSLQSTDISFFIFIKIHKLGQVLGLTVTITYFYKFSMKAQYCFCRFKFVVRTLTAQFSTTYAATQQMELVQLLPRNIFVYCQLHYKYHAIFSSVSH